MTYVEHFGVHTKDYLQFRPDYPEKLFKYLASLTSEHQLAWDCGTGNGQAAVMLAKYYEEVVATDLNQAQLDVAVIKNNIRYYPWPAEKTEITPDSVDLITVAQALHWFNLEEFYREVNRVAKPGAVIAVWSYSLGKINLGIDVLINKLYDNILGDAYWPKERKYIDEGYKTIPFPFEKITAQEFMLEKSVNFPQLIGYLNTWSAVKEYQTRNNENPVDLIEPELEMAWGDILKQHVIRWPLHLLIGRVKK